MDVLVEYRQLLFAARLQRLVVPSGLLRYLFGGDSKPVTDVADLMLGEITEMLLSALGLFVKASESDVHFRLDALHGQTAAFAEAFLQSFIYRGGQLLVALVHGVVKPCLAIGQAEAELLARLFHAPGQRLQCLDDDGKRLRLSPQRLVSFLALILERKRF